MSEDYCSTTRDINTYLYTIYEKMLNFVLKGLSLFLHIYYNVDNKGGL